MQMMKHEAFVFQPSHCTCCKDPFHAMVLGGEMQLEHSQVIFPDLLCTSADAV